MFTGGECFLLGNDLDALIAHAHQVEFDTRAISNGYWAVNAYAAAKRATRLATSGLDELMLSTGTFHQQFIPVERVIHAARAASAAGISTRISVERCDQSDFDDSIIRTELAQQITEGVVAIAHDPWISDAGGRGNARLSHNRILMHDAGYQHGGCPQILTIISVTPDQRLTACCGFPLEELPLLEIGSVANRPLDEVMTSAPTDLLHAWLHVAGPAGISEFVAKHLPGYRLPPSASICQACIALQRDKVAMAVIATHGNDVAASIATRFLQLHR